jgi:hypothetical protein
VWRHRIASESTPYHGYWNASLRRGAPLPPADAASIYRTCSARLPTDPDAPNIAVLPNHVTMPVGVAIVEGQVEFVR